MPADNATAQGLILTRELFFGSKVSGTARELGYRVNMVSDVAQVRERLAQPNSHCRCLFVDLALPGLSLDELMDALPTGEARPRVIAFGAHVHAARLDAARAAGCDEVIPHSRLSATLPEILRSHLAG
jgi:CheY-like chemotaxis protein